MVTDKQVRRLQMLIKTEKTLAIAASKSGMDEKTARKYNKCKKLPSQMKKEHPWRTRKDPFKEAWQEVCDYLQTNPALEGKTLFDYLQRKYPGKFSDGQLRTLQREIKTWRALEGPGKEVFFPQVHHPGKLCQSDFTDMAQLGITIQGEPLPHLIYHFVLTYSNWETGTLCFSESYESLSTGLQNALWELGGVPMAHRTDRLTAAVHKVGHPEEFTRHYSALLRHYGLQAQKTQARSPHENGDVEQSHNRFKKAVAQALMLRGSRDFSTRQEYEAFLRHLLSQLNWGRTERLKEEFKYLKPLPSHRLEDCKRQRARVSKSSTFRIQNNVYSVHSRLIGEWVEVRIYADSLEVWYAQRLIEKIPRLRGDDHHCIEYRHIIEWLLRKPGAFENYRWREDLFPTSRFRMAYDSLRSHTPLHATKTYLKILYLAARESERAVDKALGCLLGRGGGITVESVEALLPSEEALASLEDVTIAEVNLAVYDELLKEKAYE